MKQFSFKLEPVLAYRRLLEEGEEQKLKEIHAAISEVRARQKSLEVEIDESGQLLQGLTQGTIDMDKVRYVSAYLGKLKSDLVVASHEIATLEKDLQAQIERLLEARRKRELVEKLKEKGLSLHEKDVEALERKLHDELSVTQFGRFNKQELPTTESDS